MQGQEGGVVARDPDGHLPEPGQLRRALRAVGVGTGQVDPRRPLAQHHALGRPVDGDLQGQAGGPDEGQPAVVGAPAARPQASSSGSVRAAACSSAPGEGTTTRTGRPSTRTRRTCRTSRKPTCHVTTVSVDVREGRGTVTRVVWGSM